MIKKTVAGICLFFLGIGEVNLLNGAKTWTVVDTSHLCSVFNSRGFSIGTWIGTNDTGATETDPTGGGAAGNNMVQVSAVEYDNNAVGGDGNVTKQTALIDANSANNRVTTFLYDFRNRRTATDGEIDFYETVTYDNLSRVVRTDRRNTTGVGNLIARSEVRFDDRGRVYQSIRYGVDPTTGTVGAALTDNMWFDDAGNVIKSQPAGSKGFTKTTYDGLGRTMATYVGYDLSDTTYADATTITGDTILQQSEQTYDAASNVIQTTSRDRYHSATGTGSLGTPSSTQPKARVTYAAAYIDALGRTVAVADYGTNGGTALTRSSTIPARSDTCLVSSMTYDAVGNQTSSTDPAGLVIETTYDALGRETQRTQNPVALNSSSSSSGNTCTPCDDTNVVVQTAYNADGQVSTITALNANTGNQVTQYLYGTTLTDSAIASSLLKIAEVYPDSVDSDDRVKFTYNRQGEIVTKTDQNATVHAFDFDKLGRRTQDRVTTLGTGVDSAVRRVATTYEVRGMAQNITSYDNAAVGSGAIVNDVQIAYNSFGRVTADYQSHSGAVNVVSTPKVQYTYASGSANTIRPLTAVYPNGRVLNYSYGTANGANDVLSRVAALVDSDGTTQLAAYQYLGLGSVVEVDYTQPDMKYTLIDLTNTNDPDTGDIYSGLDRFGRVKDCRWYNYGTSTDTARIKHGYDRAGNRLYREDPVAASNGKAFDELYAYDAINRLRDMQRGTLTSAKTGITAGTRTFEQCWTLDPTGNWKGFREDADGNGTWDLVQSRSDNKVNEITAISNSVGPTWAAPAYNRAGNMTSVPQPADPTKAYTATYDAWNRLVKLVDTPTSQTVQENSYDGRTFRTLRKTYTAGVLSETRHMYYSTGWQVLEERLGTSTAAERQFTWGLRYIDDLIVRDRDSNNSGILNERLYATQDANWNVIARVNPAGTLVERYIYSAYGNPVYLTSSFAIQPTTSVSAENLYCGYYLDQCVQLFFIRKRVYHFTIGVWISRDPAGFAAGVSIYQYVEGRVIIAVDPLGNWLWMPAVLIALVVILLLREFGPWQGRRTTPVGTGRDEVRALATCCGVDLVCRRMLLELMAMVAAMPSMGKVRKYPANKCFKWCDEFIKRHMSHSWKKGAGPVDVTDIGITGLRGVITIEPVEAEAKERLVTSKYLFGMEHGAMTSHCFFRVTISSGAGTKCTVFFDLGNSTTMGEFGGDDNWFFEDEPHVSEMKPGFTESMNPPQGYNP